MKKLLCVLLALALLLAAGCSNPFSKDDKDGDEGSSKRRTQSTLSDKDDPSPDQLGEDSMIVPDFTGKKYEDVAENANYNTFFVISKTEEYTDREGHVGEIISQSLSKGAVVKRGTTIIFTVDAGVDPDHINKKMIPLFAGRSYESVIADSEYAEWFTFVKQEQYTTSDAHKGEILLQQPAAGGWAEKGTQIVLIVDMGPASFTVPDLTGYTYENALTVCVSHGLTCTKASKYNDGTHTPDTVAETYPSAGAVVYAGDTIQLTVWSTAAP